MGRACALHPNLSMPDWGFGGMLLIFLDEKDGTAVFQDRSVATDWRSVTTTRRFLLFRRGTRLGGFRVESGLTPFFSCGFLSCQELVGFRQTVK